MYLVNKDFHQKASIDKATLLGGLVLLSTVSLLYLSSCVTNSESLIQENISTELYNPNIESSLTQNSNFQKSTLETLL